MTSQKSLRMTAAVPASQGIYKEDLPQEKKDKRVPDLKTPIFVYRKDAKLKLSDYAPKAFLVDEMA